MARQKREASAKEREDEEMEDRESGSEEEEEEEEEQSMSVASEASSAEDGSDSESGDSDDGDAAGNGDGDGEDVEQVRVRFTTDVEEFKVTETTIAVPNSLRRGGLSQVINHLLALDPPVPFDFLIKEKDVLVRSTLARHMERLELSQENVLELEYAPALQPPKLSAENQWPDWIAAVDARRVAGGGVIALSGAYDGNLQFSWSPSTPANGGKGSAELTAIETVPAHRSAVKAVRQLGDDLVASAGKEGHVKLYRAELAQSDKAFKLSHSLLASCEAHTGSVEALDGASDGAHAVLASGGWDRRVCVWKIPLDRGSSTDQDDDDSDGEPSLKTRKRAGGAKEDATTTVDEPESVFDDHTDQVSGLCFDARHQPKTLFSGSWDHSLRAWDLERETCSITLRGNKVVTSLDYSASQQLLCSSHADHQLRIWDARTTGDAIVKLRLKSHKAWVSAVKWNPVRPHVLASASHDRTVKVWDARSSVPLYTLDAHTNKVLSLDWSADGRSIVSGGADSLLRVHAL